MYNKYIFKTRPYYSKDRDRYHTIFHPIRMSTAYGALRQQFIKQFPDLDQDALLQAIAWHDAGYITGNEDNEQHAASLYVQYMGQNKLVTDAILSTRITNKQYRNPVQKVLHDLDWFRFWDWYTINYDEGRILKQVVQDTGLDKETVMRNIEAFYKSIESPIYVTETCSKFQKGAMKNIRKRIQKLNQEYQNEAQ